MHDPDVVAFDIPRPWPSKSSFGGSDRRWAWKHHHTCFGEGVEDSSKCDGCRGRSNAEMFPWWKPSSYSRFMVIAGRRLYWPAIVTVWHHDPGGYDCFDKCPRDSHWKLHVHHWRIQVQPFQAARRRLLTRCEWCGGRSTKRDQANCSHSWDREGSPWWRGERGLFHGDCSSVHRAWRTCTCASPILRHDGYGECALCGRFRGYGQSDDWTHTAEVIRRHIGEGKRDREMYERIIAPLRARREQTR